MEVPLYVDRVNNRNIRYEYTYDSNNSIIGFTYNGEKYLYLKNIQQDITGIIDENNNLVVECNYDGYGNIISMVDNTTNKIGEKNPYRYRSYYYDCETSWYYLNSRYYNPNIGRFITMDEIEYLGGTSTILSYNLFTYCEGNPIIYGDNDGKAKELLINQTNSNVFSRSGGNGVDDAVVINAPKIPGVSSITIRAKSVVMPFIKNTVQTVINFVDKRIDSVEKKIKNLYKRFTTPGAGAWGFGEVYSNLEPEMLVEFGQNLMLSF
jgi:RHS repeat-associated protein